MGRRGPKPKTDRQKALQGNPGKRPVITAEEAGWTPGVPTCPPWLLPMAVELWQDIVPTIPTSLLTAADSHQLGAYCQCLARFINAECWMTENGTVAVLRDDKGAVKQQGPAPEFTIAMKYLEKATQIGERFGLTPTARQCLKGASSAASSKINEFLAAVQAAKGSKPAT